MVIITKVFVINENVHHSLILLVCDYLLICNMHQFGHYKKNGVYVPFSVRLPNIYIYPRDPCVGINPSSTHPHTFLHQFMCMCVMVVVVVVVVVVVADWPCVFVCIINLSCLYFKSCIFNKYMDYADRNVN